MIRPYHDSYILAQSAYNIKEVLGKAWAKGGRRLNPLVSLFHPALKRRGYQASRPLSYGLVQIASKMGIATNESTRVKLGQYFSNAIKRGDLNVDRVREERLCNGQQESIWCYRDNDAVRAAIEAWKKQSS